jgi:hypothetical protein
MRPLVGDHSAERSQHVAERLTTSALARREALFGAAWRRRSVVLL